MSFLKKPQFFIIGLLSLVAIGIWLRIPNVTPHKIYPDTYQNLLVARNIRIGGSVVGTLGEDGYVFPPFFMWSRPIFPLLMNALQPIVGDQVRTGEIVVFIAAVLAIVLAAVFIHEIYKNKLAAIAASLLIASSFNHIAWGGFLQTETIGVLAMLLLLWCLARRVGKASKWGETGDLVLGLAICAAVFTRFEYILLLKLIFGFLYFKNPKPQIISINVTAGFAIPSLLLLAWLYPMPETIFLLLSQMTDLIKIGVVLFAVFGVGLWILTTKPKLVARIDRFLSKYLPLEITILALYLCIQTWLPQVISFLSFDLSSMREFFGDDWLLAIGVVAGSWFIFADNKYKAWGYFSLLGVIMLGLVYWRVNPAMQRYWTHLIPLLLIPASFGYLKLFRLVTTSHRPLMRYAVPLALALLMVVQLLHSHAGLRQWRGGIWSRVSYEERSARLLTDKLSNDRFLITSFPESYFYFTNLPTQSLSDLPPFIFFDDPGKPVVIVEDMAMRDLFPTFSQVVFTNLQHYKIGEYWVGEQYVYGSRILSENEPVRLYELSYNELQLLLGKHK